MGIDEIRKAADRGPFYLLLVLGAALFVGVDPTEFVIGPSRALSGPEFITVNVIAAALLIAAGVMSFLLSRTALRTLEAFSEASALPARKALDALTEVTKQTSATDAVLRGKIVDDAMEVYRSTGLRQPSSPPAG